MDYKNYGPEDFLTDDRFIGWVKHPDEASEEFWRKWLSENPEKRDAVDQARHLLGALRFRQTRLSEERRNHMAGRIMERIDQAAVFRPDLGSASRSNSRSASQSARRASPQRAPRPDLRSVSRRPFAGRRTIARYAAAAVLIGIIAAAAFILNPSRNSGGTVYRTDYAQMKTVRLPDGSRVTLNANSELSYRLDPQTGNREVHLEGEAYFRVNHQENTVEGASGARRFIVLTPGMDIVVLGTEFNVNNRRGNTSVVLESGQVKLRFAEDARENRELVMEPGEMVSYKNAGSSLVHRSVDTRDYISWKDNLLIFNHTPLSEIVRLLEDNYDYRVRIDDPQVAEKVYEGTFPADDVSVLLKTLEKSVSLEIDGKQIIIKEKNTNQTLNIYDNPDKH